MKQQQQQPSVKENRDWERRQQGIYPFIENEAY